MKLSLNRKKEENQYFSFNYTFLYLNNYFERCILDLLFLKELEVICSSHLFCIILDACVSSAGVSCVYLCVINMVLLPKGSKIQLTR